MAALQSVENQQRLYEVFEKKHYIERTTQRNALSPSGLMLIASHLLLPRTYVTRCWVQQGVHHPWKKPGRASPCVGPPYPAGLQGVI